MLRTLFPIEARIHLVVQRVAAALYVIVVKVVRTKAGSIGKWIQVDNLLAHWIDQVSRNNIAGELLASERRTIDRSRRERVVNQIGRSILIECGGEVAGTFRLGRNS